ncbi:hypothetical protein [Methylobacter sp. BlB1]|uniref:hypothetical protein n=1 Tax=Methylobacter sp. BlB1 TaxID=2785914 RepID=UPI001893D032|nr:hypothetical protein [Methylobacter sp. BlB1]MBF6650301.1 hypothetical protein [Methylobacter sp. BlB1]
MKQTKEKIIIFLYNRLFDQVNQSNFWLYIKDYLKDESNPYQFHVISYEDTAFPLTKEQTVLLQEWQNQGLEWTPLKWHQGKELSKKFLDLFNGFLAVVKLRAKGYKYIVTLASVAGTFAYTYSTVLRLDLFMYSFEPHSEYGVDNNMWSKYSLQYKITHFLEEKAAKSAKVIASGTVFMQQRLENKWKTKAKFFKIPTVANDKKFIFNEQDRIETRKQLGISEDKWLLYYPGKFGDLYYREKFAWMYKWLKDEEPRLHLLIVTPHSDAEVKALFDSARVPSEDYTIAHSDYIDIHKYASASDFAIISVPPGPSKKFISNIKVGEYLCAGLPFLITRGVSEDYIYAEQKKVGVVVNDFIESEIKKAWPEIKAYLERNPQELRQHCRAIGLDYRGFDKLNKKFKSALVFLTTKKGKFN